MLLENHSGRATRPTKKFDDIFKAAELTLGHKNREEVRKPWVTDEMIDMMEEEGNEKAYIQRKAARNINH